jgi:transcriptional regulator with XRE-family HTH domain
MQKPTPLKRAIFESGMKQKDIAARLQMDEGHLSRIVNGLHAPQATREAIADALDRPVADLWPEPGERAA